MKDPYLIALLFRLGQIARTTSKINFRDYTPIKNFLEGFQFTWALKIVFYHIFFRKTYPRSLSAEDSATKKGEDHQGYF